MPALVAGIHVVSGSKKGVDGRAEPGHDEGRAGNERSMPYLT
jgi:hypothetical protein